MLQAEPDVAALCDHREGVADLAIRLVNRSGTSQVEAYAPNIPPHARVLPFYDPDIRLYAATPSNIPRMRGQFNKIFLCDS